MDEEIEFVEALQMPGTRDKKVSLYLTCTLTFCKTDLSEFNRLSIYINVS